MSSQIEANQNNAVTHRRDGTMVPVVMIRYTYRKRVTEFSKLKGMF